MKYFCIILFLELVCGQTVLKFDRKSFQYDLERAPLLFQQFMEKFNKTYTGEEKEIRRRVFDENLRRMNAVNQNFKGEWLAEISELSDLTYLDYAKLHNLTEANFIPDRKKDRKLVNCTLRRTYLFERFATQPPAEETEDEVVEEEEEEENKV